MNTIKCPECNLVDWSDAEMCRRCCHSFQSNESQLGSEQIEDYPENHQANQFDNQQEFNNQENNQRDFQDQDTHVQDNLDAPVQNQQYQSEYSQNQGYQQNEYQRPDQNGFSQVKPKIKIAVTSMVFGILGFPFIWFIWAAVLVGILAAIMGTSGAILGGGLAFLVIPLSLILGIVALVKIKKDPSQYGGKGFAIAGIICSTLSILFLPIIAAVAIPNLLAAYKSANEGRAMASMRKIADAQTRFMSQNRGRCGTLEELGSLQLVDVVLAKGQKAGYRYLVVAIPSENGGCDIMATPITNAAGNRSFFYSTEDYTIRAEDKNGELADKSSDVVESAVDPIPPQVSENR